MRCAKANSGWRLPKTTFDVRVAPDGRLWSLVAAEAEWPPDPEKFKRHVERHFHNVRPEAPNAEIALFDNRGRVWFHTGAQRELLLGYDGRRWFERKVSTDDPFTRSCRTRGQWRGGGNNEAVDGIAKVL